MLATPAKTSAVVKEFVSLYGRALKFTTGGVRTALVAELVLGIVTAQEDTVAIKASDVFELRQMVQEALKAKFGPHFFD